MEILNSFKSTLDSVGDIFLRVLNLELIVLIKDCPIIAKVFVDIRNGSIPKKFRKV